MSIKKIALIALISTTALSAVAAEDYFVKFNAGYAKGMKSNKAFGKTGNSAIFGLEAGTQLNDQLRISASLDYAPSFKATANVDADDVFEVSSTGDATNGVVTTGTNASVDKTKLKSMALMLNAYYDIADFNGFVPYATVGFGVARNKTKSTNVNYDATIVTTTAGVAVTTTDDNATLSLGGKTTTSFAGKLGLGVKYAVTSAVDVDFRYQYQYLGTFKTNNGDKGRLSANELLLGATYKF